VASLVWTINGVQMCLLSSVKFVRFSLAPRISDVGPSPGPASGQPEDRPRQKAESLRDSVWQALPVTQKVSLADT